MRSRSRGERQFWLMASLVIVSLGLLIAATMSYTQDFHTKVTDQLIDKSANSHQPGQQLSLLKAASWWSPYDSAVVEAQRRYYQSNSQAIQAFDTLVNSPTAVQPVYLGNSALNLLRYGAAQQFFLLASKPEASAESLQGEATALINLGDTDKGCDRARQASKLNLSSASVATLNWYCDVYLKGSGGADNTIVNRLEQAKLFAAAEKMVSNNPNKLAQDWLALAGYAQARGDTAKALELARKAYDMDHNNQMVLESVKKYAELAHDNALVQELQQRLDIVQLKY